MKQRKLSDKQKEVIRLMRDGYGCDVRYLYPPDDRRRWERFTSDTIQSLERRKLIELIPPSIFQYRLTELGKTIEL